jgi:hypothetical protein
VGAFGVASVPLECRANVADGPPLARYDASVNSRARLAISLAAVAAVAALASACGDAETGAAASPDAFVPGPSTPDAAGIPTPGGPGTGADAGGAMPDAGLARAGVCAATFGSGLTPGFGRVDGIVYAVQKPSDTACVMPNSDHIVLQVLMGGAVYRMVVNVMSDRAGISPDVRVAKLLHALPAPAWSEGWHEGAALDYVTSLGASSTTSGFAPKPMTELVTELASALAVGAAVSVYATNGAGRPESAHLIHRNKTDADGALVLTPRTNPTFVLFHFDGQAF